MCKDFTWPKAKGKAFKKAKKKYYRDNTVQGKAWKLANLKRNVIQLEGE